MPALHARVEFHPKRETRKKLEELKKRLSERTGKKLSMSEVVEGIVEEFFARNVGKVE